ncbi:HAD family hydrolase [Aurantimonas sp. MSK8Z-1]|uniref:D-glycero-alpha-D-manno-heptose-1,7-bisphosphate 7-phosphatase n=1 Tax=Mangrovibrevibacter kandeliae TaxID=2968473 RepID=UPI0021184FC4|nr:HAD family hydrolase [Aurantimonas sp. MSK8Z-1]MCW4117019.1 HAD family hydrolase [Aurantimonas sp. MSK8Z-1]
MSAVPAVFLDRDGVVVVPEFRDGRSYAPTTIDAFRLYPDIEEPLRQLKARGYRIVVVTNQPDVGRGVIAAATLAEMHARMTQALPVDEVRVCTHTRADACDCRKPRPGMLLDAARDAGIALADSFMIGDRDSDVAAGRAAGCRTIFIDLGYTAEPAPDQPDWTVASLQQAIAIILSQRP